MTKIALFGAVGKMGVRLSRNLAASDFETAHVEVLPEGRERLKRELGLDCQEPETVRTWCCWQCLEARDADAAEHVLGDHLSRAETNFRLAESK
ncbi:hypothetical protein [Algicella marina]|uniref:hypothetical protein n=1 Tax=Algicella marina TaxID=2683284 RepID=UPI0024DF4509|nr:hypothetical protein [Algicella marina]